MRLDRSVVGLLLSLSSAACATVAPPHAKRPAFDGAEEHRRLILQDEQGRIPADAMTVALRQVTAMHARAVPETAGLTRDSWKWLGPGNIGGRITTILTSPS